MKIASSSILSFNLLLVLASLLSFTSPSPPSYSAKNEVSAMSISRAVRPPRIKEKAAAVLKTNDTVVVNAPVTQSADGRTSTITLDEGETSKLMTRWAEQSLSGLMAAFATNKLNELPEHQRAEHERCNKNAHSMQAHAKCVVDLMRLRRPINAHLRAVQLLRHVRRRHDKKPTTTFISFRAKRAARPRPLPRRVIEQRAAYSLASAGASPFAVIAKQLTDVIRTLKNKPKEHSKNWGDVLDDIEESAKKLKGANVVKEMFEKRLRILSGKGIDGEKLSERQIERQLNLTNEEKALRRPMQLLREGIKLGVAIGGGNASAVDEKTISVISPKLLSILPDEDEENGKKIPVLSPSLFSLHNGTKRTELEKATSLVDGFLGARPTHRHVIHGDDHRELLNFIMEASGVTDAVQMLKDEKLNQYMERPDLRTASGQPLYFTRQNVSEMFGERETKKIDVFENLDKTYTEKQMSLLKSKGYATMTKEQMESFYGEGAPYESKEDLARFQNVTDHLVHKEIRQMIHNIAAGNVTIAPRYSECSVDPSRAARHRRAIVLSPIVLTAAVGQPGLISQPVVLSPILLTTVALSPAVLGPVILSPWLFVPLVLSPRVLSPTILDPFMFVAAVLSPLALHPIILCPGVLNVFVLNPLALSPFILSPQALVPLILSPTVLNPLIFNPLALSPVILSPSALSPVIYSPQYFTASILSPVLLSPLIGPAGEGVTVIGSPSLLS